MDVPLSAEQHARFYDALGFGPERPGSHVEPQTAAEAQAVREYLREQEIPHSSELSMSWTPSEETAAKKRELDDLLALARQRGIYDGELDEAVHDAVSRLASQINNEGTEAQIRYLLGETGVEDVRRTIEQADGCNV